MQVGVYPGSFDPLTIAHLVVAEAAVGHLRLDRIDLALSRDTLGKDHLGAATLDERVRSIERATGHLSWLRVVVVDVGLVVDIAEGYDAVVMGADKWAQVNDPAWYGDDPAARDRAVDRLPRVAIAPRGAVRVPDALLLPVPPHISEVSSTAVRQGRRDWAARPDE